jgi:hypothetical protein
VNGNGDGDGNGHGNPRPDLFHDRRGEGKRTAPYALTPMAKPSIAKVVYGGDMGVFHKTILSAPGGRKSYESLFPKFSAKEHGPGTSFGTHVPIRYS